MKVGAMITQIRKFRGKTLQELADLIGVTKQRMSAIESATDISFSTLQRVCAALEFEMMAFPVESRLEKQPNDIILNEPA